MLILILILVIICVIYLLSTVVRKDNLEVKSLYGWHYAHRGSHGNGVPENSMEAFRRAKDRGYGVELDVHLLRDGSVAVIHDSQLLRTTGLSGNVEDLTVDQLKDCFLEGTMQTIPPFCEVLDLFDGRVPLIIELKAVGGNHAELCHAVCKLLENYRGVFCLESFDPRCVYWLRRNRPDLIRGQLTENFLKNKKSSFPWIFKFLLTHQMLNFLVYPDFVAYRYADRNIFTNRLIERIWKVTSVTWTLKNKRELDSSVREGRIPIFEGFEP